jgi:biopolymer transport protein ExbD
MTATSETGGDVYWREGSAAARRISIRELLEKVEAGQIDADAQVAADGRTWRPLGSIRIFAEAFDDAGLPRRRWAGIGDEMDLAPMIDVTFQLLLFFMITVTLGKMKTLATPPAPGEGAPVNTLAAVTADCIVAEVDRQGLIKLDGQSVAPDKVRSELERLIAKRGTGMLFILAADESRWEPVVQLQDAAALAGIERIRWGKPRAPPAR